MCTLLQKFNELDLPALHSYSFGSLNRAFSLEAYIAIAKRPIVLSVVVLKESPCPRGSSRTNFQVLVLVLVLVLGSLSPRKFPRTE